MVDALEQEVDPDFQVGDGQDRAGMLRVEGQVPDFPVLEAQKPPALAAVVAAVDAVLGPRVQHVRPHGIGQQHPDGAAHRTEGFPDGLLSGQGRDTQRAEDREGHGGAVDAGHGQGLPGVLGV